MTLLVMTDGRPCVWRNFPVAVQLLKPDRVVIHDDSGDSIVRGLLRQLNPDRLIAGPERIGLAASMARAWEALAEEPTSHVFHLEDDFRLMDAPIVQMIDLLDSHGFAQVALKRQPVNPAEAAAGGWMQQHPERYTEVTDGKRRWCEHRQWFSTNPSVYSTDIPRRYSWPVVPDSERVMSRTICAEMTSAVWGGMDDPPRVKHVGRRIGCGY